MVETRLNSDERKQAIIDAATPLFAKKGFVGTTTKDIAEAAEVSEALLYRHFPGKESLFGAIQDCLCASKQSAMSLIFKLKPSTETLVFFIYLMVRCIKEPMGTGAAEADSNALPRLMFKSMTEDGKFARTFLEGSFYKLMKPFKASLHAALGAGDMVESPLNDEERLWFTHNLTIVQRLNSLPPEPVFNYQRNSQALIEDTIWFALRGMGLKDEAIAKYLDFDKLERDYNRILKHT